jgi:hypothetical protein
LLNNLVLRPFSLFHQSFSMICIEAAPVKNAIFSLAWIKQPNINGVSFRLLRTPLNVVSTPFSMNVHFTAEVPKKRCRYGV